MRESHFEVRRAGIMNRTLTVSSALAALVLSFGESGKAAVAANALSGPVAILRERDVGQGRLSRLPRQSIQGKAALRARAPLAFADAETDLTLNDGEDFPVSAVIDTAAGFAYFGTDSFPGSVVKIRLSDFTRVGALALAAGEDILTSAVIDPAGGFAYFCPDTSPATIVKVRLSDFTRVGALTLDPGEDRIRGAVIDPVAGFAYFGTGDSPGSIVKVRLSDLTRVDAIRFVYPEGGFLNCAVIDAAGGFAYFGTGNFPGRVAKVRLSDFKMVGLLQLNDGENGLLSAVIDAAGGFAYFGASGDVVTPYGIVSGPGVVVKVRLADLTRVGALTLPPGEEAPHCAVIDAPAGFAYFGVGDFPGVVAKVRLSDLVQVGALPLNDTDRDPLCAVIDRVAGFGYFGLNNTPGVVARIDLNAIPRAAAKVGGGGPLCPGGSVVIGAYLTGTPPWSVTWSDGVTQSGVATSPVLRHVSPTVTTTYTVTAVADAVGPGVTQGRATVEVESVPEMPLIIAPAAAHPGATGLVASVPFHAGNSYAWSISNGTITSGAFTSEIIFTAGTLGVTVLSVVERSPGGCASPTATARVDVTLLTLLSDLVIPAVVSAAGLNGAFFSSELTLVNRGTTDLSVTYRYVSAFGDGAAAGSASDVLPAGRQKVIPDAIAYLKSLGIPVGSSDNSFGTLRVTFSGLSPDAGAATVRTATDVPGGRAGLAYAGLTAPKLLTGPALIGGLRQNDADRSNVALLNAGAPGDGNVTLRVTVFSGDPGSPGASALPDVTIPPGGFIQYSGILASQGLFSTNGYARVERVAGTAAFYAYGVIIDNVTNDSSFVAPVSLAPAGPITGLTLPVVVETTAFSTEFVATNASDRLHELRVTYSEAHLSGGVVTFDVRLLPGQQLIVPDYVRTLRASGIVKDPVGPSFAGPLFVTDPSGDLRGISIGARISTPGGGGHYGVFMPAIVRGSEAVQRAFVYGLQQNADNRTNLALVNTGLSDESPATFRIDIVEGDTGALVPSPAIVGVPAHGFVQLNAILSTYASGVKNAWAVVTQTSGGNPFVVYAVRNDGGVPGQRTGDGTYLAADVPGVP